MSQERPRSGREENHCSASHMDRRKYLEAASVAAALGLAGCSQLGGPDEGTAGDQGGDGQTDEEQIELEDSPEFLIWDLGFMEDSINGWVEDFQSEYGDKYANPEVQTTIRGPDTESMVSYYQSGLQSGDPANVFDTQMSTYLRYAQEEVWADIEKLASNEYLDQYYESVLEIGRYDGKLQQVPFYMGTNLTYSRKKWFEQAGLEEPSLDDPWTTDEYLDAAEQIVEKSDAEFGLTTLKIGWRAWPWFHSEGIDMLNEDNTEAAFNTDRTAELFQRFRDLTDKGVIPEVTWTGTWQPQGEQFGAGNTGMFFCNGAALRLVSNYGSDWVSTDSMGTFGAPENKRYGGLLTPHTLGVTAAKTSEQMQQASLDLIKVVTNKKWQKDFLRNTTVLVPHKEALSELRNDEEFQEENPLLVRQYDQFDQVSDKLGTPPMTPASGEIWTVFEDNWEAASLGEKSVDQALDDAEQQINNALSG